MLNIDSGAANGIAINQGHCAVWGAAAGTGVSLRQDGGAAVQMRAAATTAARDEVETPAVQEETAWSEMPAPFSLPEPSNEHHFVPMLPVADWETARPSLPDVSGLSAWTVHETDYFDAGEGAAVSDFLYPAAQVHYTLLDVVWGIYGYYRPVDGGWQLNLTATPRAESFYRETMFF